MGKAKGPHVEKRLTPAQVKKAGPGRHTDGGGLYLVVDESGARRWVARLTLHGKRRDFGLGPVQTISLAEAREKAAEYRRATFLGLDPRLERPKAVGSISFADAAKQVHIDLVLSHGRNGKHKKQWLNSLETYAFPKLGKMDVAAIKSEDVVEVLRPIWGTTHETARRVKQRIGAVMDWAITKNYRSADNPVSSVLRGLKRVKVETTHFAAVGWRNAPDVWEKMQAKVDILKRDEVVGLLALQFAILTVSRSGPVRLAPAAACWRGNAAGLGGWTFVTRISLTTLQATGIGFFGLYGSTAALATTLTLATVINCIGIGFQRGTHTRWQLVTNDGTGAPTLTDMGASFAIATGGVLTLFIAAPPNGNSVWVRVVDEVSGAVFEQEIAADLPANTQFLSPRLFMNNGATAAAIAYDCSGVYVETDY